MSSDQRRLVALLVSGVLVHLAASLAVHVSSGGLDTYSFRSLDASEYHRLAINIVEHGVFSSDTAAPLTPETWRTPGYPLLLSLLIAVLGPSPVGLIIAQQLLRVVNACLIFLVARKWVDQDRAFLIALLLLCEPYGIYYSFWLMSETWFVTVLLLSWLTWLRALSSRQWVWFLLCGGLTGFLVLVRPVGVFIPLVLTAGAVVLATRRARRATGAESPGEATLRTSWQGVLCFVIACGVVLGSWMTRNRIVAGHFALSSQGGVVLAYFKATEVKLWREAKTSERYQQTSLDPSRLNEPHPIWEEIDRRLRDRFAHLSDEALLSLTWRNLAQGNRSKTDPFLVSEALAAIGWSMLRESPWATITCCAVRAISVPIFPLNLAIRPPTALDAKRARWAIVGGFYALLTCAAAVGLLRTKWNLGHVFFALGVTLVLLMATVPQLDPRFRIPLIPLLLMLAFAPIARAQPNPQSELDSTSDPAADNAGDVS